MVSKYALNLFADNVAKRSKSQNGVISRDDWKWKVSSMPLGIGDIGSTQVAVADRGSYWGMKMAELFPRLMVKV